MASAEEYHGSLVAFEGPSEAISTQLRLLPTSPQILILPGLDHYLEPHKPEDGPFQSARYVLAVHDALAKRREAALAFLRDSDPANKRLVFTNGGVVSAQAMCLSALAKYETDDDAERAEVLFSELVQNGVAGLEKIARDGFASVLFRPDEDPITKAMRAADELDRQTAALQPSNELDLTVKPRPRSMSLPIYSFDDHFGDAAPFYVFGAKTYDDVTEYENEVLRTPLPVVRHEIPARESSKAPRLEISQCEEDLHDDEAAVYSDEEYLPSHHGVFPPRSPSCIGEVYERQLSLVPEPLTPRSPSGSFQSLGPVVYGEASVVDLRPNPRKRSVRRTRSLDKLYRSKSLGGRLTDAATTIEEEDDLASSQRPFSCMVQLVRSQTSMGTYEPPTQRLSVVDRPRTIFLRPARSSMVLAPPPSGHQRRERRRAAARPSYVDRGTDAEEIPEPEPPFQPVLPFDEDLVIYFQDGTPDVLLDSAVRAYKHGRYPIMQAPSIASEPDEHDSMPGTPQSRRSASDDESVRAPTVAVSTHPNTAEAAEYDPFAYSPTPWPNGDKALGHIVSAMRTSPPPQSQDNHHPHQQTPITTKAHAAPPTPAQTPPPPVLSESEEKFHDFNVSNCHTAVAVQNALRAILGVHFPPEPEDGRDDSGRESPASGYHQFRFPLLPELDELWKPIFRKAEPGSPRQDSQWMDQIVAVGAQRGVKREYASAIVGQLEKLGSKASGVSRSGRLDFRYLIANAMQSFTAQRLTHQTTDNPFANSYLLATLILPHLETYLAAHSQVRFLLLEYPPVHLSTILALQRLVGVDMMKVAQIVDADAGEPLPFTHRRGKGSIHGQVSCPQLGGSGGDPATSAGRLSPAGAGPRSPAGSTAGGSNAEGTALSPAPENLSFSKANYLLTATATEAEIANFVATIHKILTSTWSFYVPETPPKPSAAKRRPTPLTGPFTAFPRASNSRGHEVQSPPLSPSTSKSHIIQTTVVAVHVPVPSTASASPHAPRRWIGRPTSPTKGSGVAETVHPARSTRSRPGSAWSKRPTTAETANTEAAVEATLEEDSDYDQEERRLMPMFMRKTPLQKGNSRKALKFLGLA